MNNILRQLLMVSIAMLPALTSANNRPSALMTDLVSEAGALYQNGYRVSTSMQELTDKLFENYQFAAIRSSRPTFGWVVPSIMGKNNTMQIGYHIVVDDNIADARAHKGSVWNSGEVKSSQSVAVKYGGEELKPNKTYYWSVRVKTSNGGRSEWSATESFRTAKELKEYSASFRPQVKVADKAADITRIDENTTLIDFGRASFGSLEITLDSKNDNDTIYIAIGEDKKQGRINTKPHGTVRYYRYALPLKKGRHTYPIIPAPDKRNTGPSAVLMPDYIGEVAPFRYCEVQNYKGIIGKEDILRHTAIYPFNDAASHFSSDNEILNQIWDLCKYSIKATSALGIYIDGDRERIPYEADAIINQLGHYTTDREYAMARRTSEYLLEHPTWPTEWILQALIIAWYDYMYSGDIRSIEANYDILKARSLRYLRRANGLISTTDDKVKQPEFKQSIRFNGNIRDIVDWPRCGDWPHGEDDHYVLAEYNTVVNAFHYNVLRILQQMAQLTGRTDEATELGKECDALYATFNKLLFDQEKGIYRDGVGADHHTLHANHFSLALGLVPADKQAGVMDYIRTRGMACSVYAAQFLMDAIYEANDGDYGLEMLTKQDERGWYNMVRNNATITYEAWDDKFKNNQDWNHAWGAAPANIIPRRLIGVRPLKAGFEQMIIEPQSSSLKNIEATVPTIRGAVDVKITKSDELYRMEVVTPANTTAEVSLPSFENVGQLRINGRKAALKHTADGRIDCGTIGSGRYVFEVVFGN